MESGYPPQGQQGDVQQPRVPASHKIMGASMAASRLVEIKVNLRRQGAEAAASVAAGVDWNTLPSTSILGPVFGYSEASRMRHVLSNIVAASYLLQRELDSQEKQALAEATAKKLAIQARGTPTCILAGTGMAWLGRNTMKFPFWTPPPGLLDPNCFPSQRMPWVRGINARYTWYSIRAACYGITAVPFAAILFGLAGNNQMISAIQGDPRMGALLDAGIRLVQQQLPRNRTQGQQPGAVNRPQFPQLPPDVPAAERAPYFSSPYSTSQDQEGASASAGAYSTSTDAADQGTPAVPDTQSWNQKATQRTQPSPPPSGTASNTSTSWSDDDYLFDDASPAAPEAQRNSAQAAATSTSESTSWADLRRRAKAQADSSPQGNHNAKVPLWAQQRQNTAREGAAQGQSAASASVDEDNTAAAREQAQREFDAMLERERQGGSSRR